MLEGDRQGEKLGEFESQFRRLKPKYGVYGIPGNHDLHRANAVIFFNQAGIRVLKDTVEEIDNAFYLVGRNDGRSGGRKSIEELLRDCDKSLPVIVLEHRPTDLDNVSRSGADILLSGHTHNGQLFPVNFITRRYYELSWGYKLKKGTHVFVTSGIPGLGPSGPDSGRFGNSHRQCLFQRGSLTDGVPKEVCFPKVHIPRTPLSFNYSGKSEYKMAGELWI